MQTNAKSTILLKGHNRSESSQTVAIAPSSHTMATKTGFLLKAIHLFPKLNPLLAAGIYSTCFVNTILGSKGCQNIVLSVNGGLKAFDDKNNTKEDIISV